MTLKEGCKTTIETCLGLTEDDRVVIVADEQSEDIGLALRKASLEITPQTRYYKLELYENRPVSKLPEPIKKSTEKATASIWTAGVIKGELETVRRPFIKAALMNGRLAHMVGITKESMESAVAVDYNSVEKFTKKILGMAKRCDTFKVKTEKGTDFEAEVGVYKWVASTGIIRGVGSWYNIPAGMIYTTPSSMKGTVVIDGTLGEHFERKYNLSDIEEAPIEIKIKDNPKPEAVKVSCENKELEEDLKKYIGQHKCSSYIGEIGLGTNIFIEALSGKIVQDEKYPALHIACGDPEGDMTFAGWSCPEHLDMIVQKPDIWFDYKKIMEKGSYLVE